MKKTILTLFFTLVVLSSLAVDYKLFGEGRNFSKKLETTSYIYDCYNNGGDYRATLVKCKFLEASYSLFQYNIQSKVTADDVTYTVEAIADEAFSNLKNNVNIITLPNTVETIGHYAFANSIDLVRFNMGTGVKYIGNYAFSNCPNLCSLTMSPKVISIGKLAFSASQKLENFYLPSTIMSLGDDGDALGGLVGLKCIEWELDHECWDPKSLANHTLFYGVPGNVIIRTKTKKQAELARTVFENVYCDEEKDNHTTLTYYKGLFDFQYIENTDLVKHNKKLAGCDVNEDSQVNSADIVTIYNRIIDGAVNTYRGQEYVDMGTGNGVLWATCNLGATSPEIIGDYFAWGDNGFMSYKYNTAFGRNGFTKENYLPSEDAKAITSGELPQNATPIQFLYGSSWGGKWRMPTQVEVIQLIYYCTVTETKLNGRKCLELTSKKNGNKLYFPICGMIDGASQTNAHFPYYWTSSSQSDDTANMMDFYFTGKTANKRYLGMCIRPVVSKSDLDEPQIRN